MKLFHRKKKNKNHTMTINDCVEHYRKNPEYRYALIGFLDKQSKPIPISISKTKKEAEMDFDFYWHCPSVLPAQIIDLAFYETKISI